MSSRPGFHGCLHKTDRWHRFLHKDRKHDNICLDLTADKSPEILHAAFQIQYALYVHPIRTYKYVHFRRTTEEYRDDALAFPPSVLPPPDTAPYSFYHLASATFPLGNPAMQGFPAGLILHKMLTDSPCLDPRSALRSYCTFLTYPACLWHTLQNTCWKLRKSA